MLINRNNYETFFLLYADEELCAEERLVVEQFVEANEDLRGELHMITASILPAEDCTYGLKELLYKNSFVDGTMQENLLLKIDNELSTEEINELNTFISENKAAIKEENILLASKLDAAETITFPNKELLYKREKDHIVVFRIFKWAAAAILIGVSLFFGYSLLNKKSLPDNTIAVKGIDKPFLNKINNALVKEQQNVTDKKTEFNNIISNNSAPIHNRKVLEIVASDKKERKELTSENVLPIESKELASNQPNPKTSAATDYPVVQQINAPVIASLTKPEKVQIALTNDNIVPLETSYAQAVTLNETEKSNNKILYMDVEDVKRSKVGSVFKKFKRMIERTAKIKTGNPIRIAGFQIGTD